LKLKCDKCILCNDYTIRSFFRDGFFYEYFYRILSKEEKSSTDLLFLIVLSVTIKIVEKVSLKDQPYLFCYFKESRKTINDPILAVPVR